MVEMSGSVLAPERWQHLPLFDDAAPHILAFLGWPALALTPCQAAALTAWTVGCGDGDGPPAMIRLSGCLCSSVVECAWAVGQAAQPAARAALAGAMRMGSSHLHTEERLLLQILGKDVP